MFKVFNMNVRPAFCGMVEQTLYTSLIKHTWFLFLESKSISFHFSFAATFTFDPTPKVTDHTCPDGKLFSYVVHLCYAFKHIESLFVCFDDI